MNVFVVNAGSSSVKAGYFEGADWAAGDGEPAWSAEVRWAGSGMNPMLAWRSADGNGAFAIEAGAPGEAVDAIVATSMETYGIAPDAIGHRIVHGLGETRCTLLDARVARVIADAAELAPLHGRGALAGIDAMARHFPQVPQAVDFDTAFHTTLPDAAAAYALPYDWFATRGLRKYGFHGISHRACARRIAELVGPSAQPLRIVSAHLGSGCSLAAVVDGVSVDTTMGFTPLDGVAMGTRSGSVDPGLLFHLLRTGAYDAAALERILDEGSGLLGLSQISADMREVEAAAAAGAVPAQLALDVYAHRLAGAVATMAAAAGGIDALAFTGGVGEHAAGLRARVCARLAFLGIALGGGAAPALEPDDEIGAATSAVRVFVIRAREEFAIARDVDALLARTPALR